MIFSEQLPILAKWTYFFEKKGTKNFSTPYFIPFLGVLNQNKALHNFQKWGQHLTFGRIKGLDEGLMEHPTCLVLRLE